MRALLFGLKKLPPKHRLHIGVKKFLNSVEVLAWPPEAAEFYADIRYELTRTGNPIGEMDMLIAAHAIAIGAVLVTNDKAFAQVEDLHATENWATDLV